MDELDLLRDHSGLYNQVKWDAVPDCMGGYTHWQDGYVSHASAARNILGSTILTAKSDNGLDVNIRYPVLDRSSQCIIGRNAKKHASILRAERNAVELFVVGIHDCFSITENEFLSGIPLVVFAPEIGKETL